MAETQGSVGYGTKISIEVDDGGTSAFVLIGEAKDISGPQISQQFADFTHMQSPAGFQEQKPTYKSSGQQTFNVNRVPGDEGQEALMTAALANPTDLCKFKIEYPDGDTWTYSAYPAFSLTSPMAGAIEMAITLTITGLPVRQTTP